MTDCGKHDLLCSDDSGEYPSHLHRVQTLFLTTNGLKRSYEMQFTIAHIKFSVRAVTLNPLIMKMGPGLVSRVNSQYRTKQIKKFMEDLYLSQVRPPLNIDTTETFVNLSV